MIYLLKNEPNKLKRAFFFIFFLQLDTKSSPLALLAQTCSAIGAESTNPKLAVIIEKSTKSMKSNCDGRDKTSPLSSHSSSSVSTGSVEQQQQAPPTQSQSQSQQQQQQQQSQPKSSFKPYESNNNHLRERMDQETERAHNLCTVNTNNNNNTNGQCHNTTTATTHSSHRVKTPKPTNGQHQHHHHQQTHQHQHQQQRCDSNQSATSQRDSPAAASTPISNGLRRTPSAQAMDLQSRVPGSSSNSPQLRGSSKESPPVPTSASQISSGATASQSSASATARLQAASDAAAYAAKEANYVKALHAAAAAASGGSGSNGSNSGGGGGGGASYYPGYGGSGYPPMDLMTASALMNPHHPMFKAAALSPYLNYARLKGIDPATAAAMMSPNVCRDPFCTSCPASPHFLNKAAGQPCPAGCQQCDNGSKSNAGMSSGGSQAAAAAAASYHAQLAALAAASQMPYVCSWIGTDAAYCGKRFSASDELFQHLRTHTASMPDSVLNAAAAGGIPPNHPLFRTYPTPPLSPLSAAARYHPYGKPSMLPPPLGPPGMPMPPHPALAQYFSPYALYGGPRMGSSHP